MRNKNLGAFVFLLLFASTLAVAQGYDFIPAKSNDFGYPRHSRSLFAQEDIFSGKFVDRKLQLRNKLIFKEKKV